MLEIRNLNVHYGGIHALRGINLEVDDGKIISLIGANGAGKSTLLNCIAGVFPADEGEILLDGRNITKMPEYKRAAYIGRVFQDPLKGTAFDMTIEENLAIAAAKGKCRGLQPGITRADKKEFREKLASLGMELLLLDEHTAALDPAAAEKVLSLTEEFAYGKKMCTLMITHNMKDSLHYGNRTILMQDGKIVMDLEGEDRKNMTVEKLVEKFSIDNDRMLL